MWKIFKSKKALGLDDLKGIVILLALVSLIAAATGIALSSFQTSSGVTANSAAYNITGNGLQGVVQATSFLSTTGIIAGVAVLIGIVVAAFAFGRR